MLAKIVAPSNDFAAIATYLVHGKSGTPHRDRVAWVRAHNLPTEDPDLAATARLSPRTRKAAYHTIIAWHQAEDSSPKIMQEIAFKTLELAGLAEHQALIMGHGDTPHRHCHLLINRVHPTTGKAWKTSHDFARFERIMAHLSEDYGFQFVPSHIFNPELTEDQPKMPNSRATYAAKRGANTSRPQWSRRHTQAFATRISDDLTMATAWDDLEHLFIDFGLTLEPKGQGYVVGDANGYTKLSALGLIKTANGFAKRRQKTRKSPAPPLPARSLFDVDGVDILRAFQAFGLVDRDAVPEAIADAQRARDDALQAAPVLVRLLRNTLTASTHLKPMPSRAKVRKRRAASKLAR